MVPDVRRKPQIKVINEKKTNKGLRCIVSGLSTSTTQCLLECGLGEVHFCHPCLPNDHLFSKIKTTYILNVHCLAHRCEIKPNLFARLRDCGRSKVHNSRPRLSVNRLFWETTEMF